MADYSVIRSAHKTLSGATVDSVRISGGYSSVEVLNRAAGGGADVYFTIDDSTPVVGADETYIVPAGTSLMVRSSLSSATIETVKLIGNGNAYSVQGVNE